MAVITQYAGVVKEQGGPVTLARTTMSASDTLTYTQGSSQILGLYNTTASIVTVTLLGTAPTTLNPAGYGASLSTSAGKTVSVPASGLVLVDLDDIWAFLTPTGGTVTITNGTGLVAYLYV